MADGANIEGVTPMSGEPTNPAEVVVSAGTQATSTTEVSSETPAPEPVSKLGTIGDLQRAMRASGELPPDSIPEQPATDSTSIPTEGTPSTKGRTPRIHFEGKREADPRQQGPMLDSMLEEQNLARAQAEAEALASATTQPQTETTVTTQEALPPAPKAVNESRVNRFLRLIRLRGKAPAVEQPSSPPSTIKLTEPTYGIVRQGGKSPFMKRLEEGSGISVPQSGTVGEALAQRPSVGRSISTGDVLGTTPADSTPAPTTQ